MREAYRRDDGPRLRPLAAAAAVIALFGVALTGLGSVLAPGEWARWSLAVAGATVGVAALARSLLPRLRIGACVAGLAAGAVVVVAQVHAAGRLGEWVTDPDALVREARLAIYAGSAPVEVGGGLADLVLVACLALAWTAALLLVGMGALLLAGVVPAALLVVGPVVTSMHVSAGLMAACGALLGALLWIGAPPRRGWWRGALAVALTVALAAGLGALLPPSRDRVWNTAAIATGPVWDGVPDVTVALGEDLRERGDTPVLRYSGPSEGTATRFTLAVLTDLEGGTWRPEEDTGEDSVLNPRSPLDPGDPMASVWSPSLVASGAMSIRVEGLLSTWLPLSQGTQRVVPDGATGWAASDWRWVAETQTARSESGVTARDDAYTVVACPLLAGQMPNACGSLDDGSSWPVADPAPGLAAYRALPEGVPAEIAEAAGQATLGAPTRKDAAEALAGWFRSGSFAYDEDAPYTPGADPDDPYQTMSAFLETRRGYCVHFATAFAVMARSLGMPARIAVGYASRSEGSGWTTVTARDLHAWPEVYFEDVGWVAYEPTPGGAGARADGGSGAAAGAADPGPSGSPASAPTPSGTRSADPGAASGPSAADPADGSGPADGAGSGAGGLGSAGPVAGLLAALAMLVAALAPAAIRWRRRRRRRRGIEEGASPAADAWAELVDTALDTGALAPVSGRAPSGGRATASSPPPRARTPEAVAERLGTAMGAGGAAAARALADAVVAERFGGAVSDRAGLRRDLADGIRDLLRAAPLRARFWPRSVVPRLRARPWRR
ncbi:MAG: transglutaminase-like domain-containing protein [Actinomyces sp.]|nr:transglutaminase domain-containing protein [Actinomyces sp.]MCI1662793.1 transglutaminase-like domain-containing protein [Actinomyces sp.]MCI1691396.1 transglutaminase-like domain-containing protein [Actinomyces sp.]